MRKFRTTALLTLILCLLLLCGCSDRLEPTAPPVSAPASPAVTKHVPPPTPRPLLPVEVNTGELDQSLFWPSGEPGTVVREQYTTKDYRLENSEPYTKEMLVYLPHGYKETEQYNVLFLMHVASADEEFWLNNVMSYSAKSCGYFDASPKLLIDNMIEKGYCEPCIVVSLDGFLTDGMRWAHDTSFAYTQFAREIGNDIMPFIAEKYSTYAQSGSREDLAAARDHFGFMGASYGAYLCYLSIMPDNLDLFSNFGLSGGGGMSYDSLALAWANHGTSELPIHCLYIGTGEFDNRQGPEAAKISFLSHSEKFTEDNLIFNLYGWTSHEPREWINSFYNCMQLFFR